MDETASAWLEARGLDPELAVKMGWDAGRDRSGKAWLRIPYVRNGQPINHKFRALDEKRFRNTPGAEHDLWNVDCLKNEELAGTPIYLTEGEMDALALLQCGFGRVVSIPDGWTEGIEDGTETLKHKVLRMNEGLMTGNKIIVAGDNDGPGHSFVRAVSNFFTDDDVYSVSWPEGCKDANDCLRDHGPTAVVEAINHAKLVDPPGGVITGFSDLPPQPPRRIWKLGLDDFARSVAFRSREISVLTGMPGVGKTTFLTWCMHRLVRQHDIRIGAIMMESDYDQEVLDQLSRLNGEPSDPDRAFKKKMDRNFRLVSITETEDTPHDAVWLKQFIYKLAARDGCDLIIIDPWNELEHMPEQNESMTNYINFVLKKLRQWAAKYDIHILVVAHPRKLQNGERPNGYSVADSAGFFNKAGMGYALSEENDEEFGRYVQLSTWKVRNRKQTGCRPGFLRMSFDEFTMSYRKMIKISNSE